jgi:hypothetical protein
VGASNRAAIPIMRTTCPLMRNHGQATSSDAGRGWAGKAGGGGLGEGDQLAQGGIEGVLGELVAEPVQAGVGDVRLVDHGLGGGGVGEVVVGEVAANQPVPE